MTRWASLGEKAEGVGFRREAERKVGVGGMRDAKIGGGFGGGGRGRGRR